MPVDTLPVHVNREELHALEVPETFEATGTFDIRLVNHGESVHVHVHLDDALSTVASVDASNHFIDGDSERVLRVPIDGDVPARGRLKVASGYGATTRYVDVELVEPEESEETVTVDESLSQPQSIDSEPSESLVDVIAENPELIVLGLGVLAILVAAGAAIVIDSVVVLLGALAVLAAVLGAMYVLVSGE